MQIPKTAVTENTKKKEKKNRTSQQRRKIKIS